MNSTVFSLSFLFFSHLNLQAENYSDSQLLEIGKSAIDKRASAKGPEEEKFAFRSALNGLSNAQKIRAIAYRVLASDENPKYNMRSSNSLVAAYALGQDHELISDWSELRVMLKETKDPRKFFLIAGLIPWSRNEHKHDFVYELTHMLFSVGRVAKDEGEYTKSYADNVSEYAYSAILSSLRSLKADFDPPSKELPHEERVLILAKWLKERWPGCENLEIPERLTPGEKRPDKKKQADETSLHSSAKKTLKEYASETAIAEQTAKKNHWPWLIGGGMLLGILFFLIRVFKTR